MENIMARICWKFTSGVIKFFSENKIRSIEEMETDLEQKADQFLTEMMQAYLEGLNQAIIEDKAGRRRRGLLLNAGAISGRYIPGLGS